MNLPTRFHIGTQRAASTYLYNLIKQHPDTGLSPNQEVNFFQKHFDKGTGWYRDQFPGEGVSIDTSPKYFQKGKTVAPRIKQTIPGEEATFLLILRNPIDYVHSHYRMHSQSGYFDSNRDQYPQPTQTLPEHLERYPSYGERALYAKNLKQNWFHHFDAEQFHVILFEDFIDQTQTHLSSILKFWGLPPRRIETVSSAKNKTLRFSWLYEVRSRIIQSETLKNLLKRSRLFNVLYDWLLTVDAPRLSQPQRTRVKSWFESDVENLKRLLDRPLQPWTDFRTD